MTLESSARVIANAPALSAADVHLTYANGIRALDGITLAVPRGEFTGIIGPNGSGKSTLLRVLAGIQAVDSGTVLIERQPARELDNRARARRVALVPQTLEVLPGYTAEDFVLLGRYAHLSGWNLFSRHDREAARRSLASVEALEFKDREMHQLSGGERQRVLIARALTQQAETILLDEPTSALDLKHQLAVFGLVHRLCRQERRTIVVVTHDLNLASQFSDRLVLMQHGRIAETGTPAQVLRRELLERVYETTLAQGAFAASGTNGSRPWVLPRARFDDK